MSAAPDTPIGITVSGSTFTSGVPIKFQSWTAVRIDSTGTLPAPLTASATYYIMLSTLTTFTLALVIGGSPITLTTVGSGQLSVRNVTLNNAIDAKIALAKDWMHQTLQLEIQNRVPMIAWRWMNRKRGQVDYFAQSLRREFEILSKTAQIPIVPGVYDGSVIDLYMLLSMTQGLVPRTFSASQAPINGVRGTYVGEAYPGSVFVDTQSDKMYYQTGTLDCPIWTRPNAAFVLDNLLNASSGRIQSYSIANGGSGYLLGDTGTIAGGAFKAIYVVTAVSGSAIAGIRLANVGTGYLIASALATSATYGIGTGFTLSITSLLPNVLLHAAVDYTLWAMAGDGMFANQMYDPNYQGYIGQAESTFAKRAKARLAEVIPLLELDIDGDGSISDFEAELTHSPQGVFA